MHTPGHTPGSCVIICDRTIFSGDTLFAENCGRCDLPGGNFEQMLVSLKRIARLEGDYKVYPGHEDSTTLKGRGKTTRTSAAGIGMWDCAFRGHEHGTPPSRLCCKIFPEERVEFAKNRRKNRTMIAITLLARLFSENDRTVKTTISLRGSTESDSAREDIGGASGHKKKSLVNSRSAARFLWRRKSLRGYLAWGPLPGYAL
jgi:hypothetical protein